MKGSKHILRRGAEHFAALLGPHRWRKGSQLLILMYHRILPPSDIRYQDEQPGMLVQPDTFRSHLQWVKNYFEPVLLRDWLLAVAEGENVPQRACAITFDDGWRDNYEFAFPLLRSEGVPATIFMVSDYIGTTRLFWPERLARVLRLASARNESIWDSTGFRWLQTLSLPIKPGPLAVDMDYIDAVIVAAKLYNDAELHDRIDDMYRCVGESESDLIAQVVNWSEAGEMVRSGLIDVGSHTRHHTRLTTETSFATLEDEIIGSKQRLQDGLSVEPVTFCYPNGDVCSKAKHLVRSHYRGACTTARGWNHRQGDPYQLRRISIHEDIAKDQTAFYASLAGWF